MYMKQFLCVTMTHIIQRFGAIISEYTYDTPIKSNVTSSLKVNHHNDYIM